MSANNSKLTTYTELAEVLEQLPLLVQAERRRRGISQRQVSREVGLSSAFMVLFERGENVTLENALRLLRWLDGAS